MWHFAGRSPGRRGTQARRVAGPRIRCGYGVDGSPRSEKDRSHVAGRWSKIRGISASKLLHPPRSLPGSGDRAYQSLRVGDDYHLRLKERLFALLSWLQETVPGTQGRAFVDSAPIMDKAWAARAGLGWIGKHSNLISPDHGSWTFIGELVVTAEIAPDQPITDHCGTCTACIDACPTSAIVEPYVIDANRCISYTTIEYRGDRIPKHCRWPWQLDIRM